MADQIGSTRLFEVGDKDKKKVLCPQCGVYSVPKKLIQVSSEVGCNNCGHVYGRDALVRNPIKLPVSVTSVTITGGNTITTDKGTKQLSALVLPAEAGNKSVTWSIQNGTGAATISASGLVTAQADGTVTAKATSVAEPSVSGTYAITISNQLVKVSSITVTGAGNATTITVDKATLQMSAAVLPANATDKALTWSVDNGTGSATISAGGLLTPKTNGTVTVKASASDGSYAVGQIVITISNQTTKVTGITVTGAGSATTITTDKGTLQMAAAVLPAGATDKTVTWSVVNGTGTATINASGLLSALTDGTVTVKATAKDGSAVVGQLVITLSNQVAA